MSDIHIRWHGHSCVSVEKDGYTIVLDPYQDDSVQGLKPLRLTADLVLSSHRHFDHFAPECVTLRESGQECPFEITEIHSFHDANGGQDRGENIIRILSDGEYRIAHAGDIGCFPTEEQLVQLMGLDVFLVPVGGYYTMEPEDVHRLVEEIKPCVTVPMHYKCDGFGLQVVAPLSAYSHLCEDVTVYDRDVLNLPEDLSTQTAVLRCTAAER